MYNSKTLETIKEKRISWEEKILAKFLEKGELKKKYETSSKIPLKQVYGPEDIHNIDYLKDNGIPGMEPFMRGIYPTMYRGRLWTMRQYSGFANAKKTNERFKYLISQGQKGLSIAFDLPTQMGYDADNELCKGEVGKVGVSISTLQDLEQVFDSIPLDKISTSMTINAPTAIILAMYIAVAEKKGVKPKQLTGTVQNDILKEYIARGTYIFPPVPSLRLTCDAIEYCTNNLPRFNTISISGYHMREAGSNAVQEIAFTLANGIAYTEEILKRGIDIDDFAPRLSFFFSSQNNFFEEIAKFRAARKIWSNIMKIRFKAKNPNSLRLRFHTQTAGVSLTAQEPYNNIVRVAFQALSAVLGGTQSLHTCGFDEALAIPTENSVKLSLRTQQVLAYETGVTHVVDPLGGSYFIESLTLELENKIKTYLEIIEELGGMAIAIEKNYIQNEIQKNAYSIQKKIDSGNEKIIGVNTFRSEDNMKINTFRVNLEIEKKIISDLITLKSKRDNKKVKMNLKKLKRIAKTSENLMPIIIETVKNYATIQEICDVLRGIFGEHKSSQSF